MLGLLRGPNCLGYLGSLGFCRCSQQLRTSQRQSENQLPNAFASSHSRWQTCVFAVDVCRASHLMTLGPNRSQPAECSEHSTDAFGSCPAGAVHFFGHAPVLQQPAMLQSMAGLRLVQALQVPGGIPRGHSPQLLVTIRAVLQFR